MIKSWSIFLLIIFLTSTANAEVISLDNLIVNTSTAWCSNESTKLEIIPIDASNNFTRVDNIRVIINNMTYEQTALYLKQDKYLLYITINNEPANFTIDIIADQQGKVVSKNKTIEVVDCYKYSKLTTMLQQIDSFINKYIVTIICVSLIALAIFIAIKITKT